MRMSRRDRPGRRELQDLLDLRAQWVLKAQGEHLPERRRRPTGLHESAPNIFHVPRIYHSLLLFDAGALHPAPGFLPQMRCIPPLHAISDLAFGLL